MMSLSPISHVFGLVMLVIKGCILCSSPFYHHWLWSEERKSTSHSAVQVKNRQKAVNVGRKLNVTNLLEKGERFFYLCCNVKYVDISLCTIRDNADLLTENAKSELKHLCSKTTAYCSPLRMNHTRNY